MQILLTQSKFEVTVVSNDDSTRFSQNAFNFSPFMIGDSENVLFGIEWSY